jgi:predicted glycosyltransferase
MLRLLCARRGLALDGAAIAAVLWPDRAPADPDAVVASLVSRLRRVLGADAVLGGRDGYRLGALDTDADRARRLLDDAVARLPRVRDRAIFVGDPQDVVPASFGPGLPDIRDWTTAHYDFSGYVTGFDPAEIADPAALRESVGFGDEPVCVVAVGGSGVGRHLLRRAVESYPLLREHRPGMRMVVVTGPRIDRASLDAPPGVEVRGWVPDLHRVLAAADVALVQGGLTTTMELTAAGRPFVYVPLQNHFEQNIHVRHRLARYGAGVCVPWPEASPDRLAGELSTLVGARPDYRPVATDGAVRAGALLAELL